MVVAVLILKPPPPATATRLPQSSSMREAFVRIQRARRPKPPAAYIHRPTSQIIRRRGAKPSILRIGTAQVMATYTVLTTISGIYLEGRDQLHLQGGVLARNPEAEPWWDSPENHPADVVPEGQTDLNLRKISRWVLACQIEASKPTLGRVKDYLEKVSLPLILGTPATVALGDVKLAQGPLNEVLVAGLQQSAPVTYGVNCFIRLTRRESAVMETALAHLTYLPQFAVPLVHYLNAFHEPGLPYHPRGPGHGPSGLQSPHRHCVRPGGARRATVHCHRADERRGC